MIAVEKRRVRRTKESAHPRESSDLGVRRVGRSTKRMRRMIGSEVRSRAWLTRKERIREGGES